MRTIITLAVLLCTSGCTVSLEGARTAGLKKSVELSASEPSEYCRRLDNQHATWGAIAKSSGALAGGAGLATIPLGQERDAQIALASAAVGTAAIAVAATYIAEKKAEQWARHCAER
jgi:hypothetical protein